MSITEFVYTSVLKPPLLKTIANKVILALLPRTVSIKNAKVVLNPNDPVVSGALTFGVYEKHEIEFMLRACKPGQIMLDIGANVGLYTAISGLALESNGKVFAFEPDPESLRFLEQTVAENGLKNVNIVKSAASNANGITQLHTCSSNRGDNRLYDNKNSDGSVEVKTISIDNYLVDQKIVSVDTIKIDVQGFEGYVIDGMENTLRNSPKLQMLMEFWPLGLLSAGTNPHELLQKLSDTGLTLYELKEKGDFIPIKDRAEFVNRFP